MKVYVWFILPIAIFLILRCSENDIATKPSNELSTTSSASIQSEATIDPGDDKEMNSKYKLFVKGEEVASVKYNAEHRYVELPLTAVSIALGAKVEWKNDTTATITFDDIDYILNIEENSLVEAGTTFNIITLAPGSRHAAYHQMIEGELVVDSDSIKLLLHLIGARIRIDHDALVVSID